LTLAPFGSADGVVARGAARLVTIASGLDRHGLGVPEVHWMRKAGAYRRAAQAFAGGSTEGVTEWLLLCCGALHAGALDALGIAEAGAKR
ncbi:MAG: oxidoreductase, partial [Mycolicibacter algericus]